MLHFITFVFNPDHAWQASGNIAFMPIWPWPAFRSVAERTHCVSVFTAFFAKRATKNDTPRRFVTIFTVPATIRDNFDLFRDSHSRGQRPAAGAPSRVDAPEIRRAHAPRGRSGRLPGIWALLA
jgi:hypothetical protein